MRSSDPTIANGTVPAAGRCASRRGLRRHVRDGARPRRTLGVIGLVYPIAGPNLLEAILGKLPRGRRRRHARPTAARVAGSGSGEASKTSARGGLSRTRQPRRFHHDPSIVVQEAIRDADGRVIVPPGTVVNRSTP